MLLAGTSRKLHVTLLAFESQMVEIYEVGFTLQSFMEIKMVKRLVFLYKILFRK